MFKAVLNGKTCDKNTQEFSCLIPISVGQSLHEGEKLDATIQLINATFKSCTIVIADTLYRHTTPYNEGETVDNVHKRARVSGEEWHTRNAEILAKLTIPHKIVSWDEYLQSESYPNKKEFIEKLYNEDSTFKKAVDGAVGKFIKRQKSSDTEATLALALAFKDSLEYLKEECAVWLLWAEQQEHNFLVYPNKLYAPLAYLKKFFPDTNNPILQPLVISFQTVKKSIALQDGLQTGNGLSYVQSFMASDTSQQPNPASFFHAKPPVCLQMNKDELSFFVRGHLDFMMRMMKELDAKRQQSFITYYLAQLTQLTNPITITDDSDSSSDSSEHDGSPELKPADDPVIPLQQLRIDGSK